MRSFACLKSLSFAEVRIPHTEEKAGVQTGKKQYAPREKRDSEISATLPALEALSGISRRCELIKPEEAFHCETLIRGEQVRYPGAAV